MFKFDFSRDKFEYIMQQCCFTKDEIEILNLRRNQHTVEQMTFKMNLSRSSITRRIKSINKKIMNLS